eukprot:1187470-Prorocentrum_minimum.AAC.1
MVTSLSTEQAAQLKELEQHVTNSDRVMVADRIGLLYYTLLSDDPSRGLSLLSSSDCNQKLIGFWLQSEKERRLNPLEGSSLKV